MDSSHLFLFGSDCARFCLLIVLNPVFCYTSWWALGFWLLGGAEGSGRKLMNLFVGLCSRSCSIILSLFYDYWCMVGSVVSSLTIEYPGWSRLELCLVLLFLILGTRLKLIVALLVQFRLTFRCHVFERSGCITCFEG